VPQDAWQHPSCPEPGLRSSGHGTHGGPRAALRQGSGAGATRGAAAPELPVPGGITQCYGHVGVCERTSCPSSQLGACMQRYPVCRVSTMGKRSKPCFYYVPMFSFCRPILLMGMGT
jgi:hypothetical protein